MCYSYALHVRYTIFTLLFIFIHSQANFENDFVFFLLIVSCKPLSFSWAGKKLAEINALEEQEQEKAEENSLFEYSGSITGEPI